MADRLLGIYGRAKDSHPLKKIAAWAFVRCRVKKAAPYLLDDLESESKRVRGIAYRSPEGIFGSDCPEFDVDAADAVRAEQTRTIRAWVRKQG